jgi:hypothetical protein
MATRTIIVAIPDQPAAALASVDFHEIGVVVLQKVKDTLPVNDHITLTSAVIS